MRPLLEDQKEMARIVFEAVQDEGSINKAATKLDISRFAAQRYYKIAAAIGLLGTDPVLPGFEIAQVATLKNDAGKTEKTWVKQRPEKGDPFEVPEGQVIKGVSALTDADGRVIAKWIKTKEGAFPVLEEALRARFDSVVPVRELPAPTARLEEDLLVVYPIADLHLGMFAWAKEGGTDYDLKIAQDAIMDSTLDLIVRSSPAATGLILDLGDYFHADNSRNQTARSGNPLDVDTRYAKVVQVGVDIIIDLIELALSKHERVVYRKLPGNHDDESSVLLSIAIAAHFRLNPRVKVEVDPSRFFVYPHGKALVAATHGDMLKMQDLAGFTAAQWPKLWGESVFRYGYTGHIHNHKQFNADTLRGMTVESFNTLAGKDAWHAGMGYQAPRSMVAITLDKEKGERARMTVTLPS